MKFCRYVADGRTSYGLVAGEAVKELAASPLAGEVVETGRSFTLSEVALLAPVDPPNILAIGLNYRRHAEETGAALPDHPVLFIKATSSLTGPNTAIVLPAVAADEVDYEVELAVVIGKTAKKVAADNALDYVFGYTVGNDISARDCQQRRDRQWARAKSFDTFCPLGPWIETDLNPADLAISLTLNGQTMQTSSTADLIFGIPQIIAHLSENITLPTGTVILTGTPSGVGVARTPQRFLRPGDRLEATVEGIGSLVNWIVADQ